MKDKKDLVDNLSQEIDTTIVIPITKTRTKMKDMFRVMREVYREDKREFWESVLGSILVVGFGIFLMWFAGTFCYDM
jgi:hypothetical protein